MPTDLTPLTLDERDALSATLIRVCDHPRAGTLDVITTRRSRDYHLDGECRGLERGQANSAKLGRNVYDRVETPLPEVVLVKRPCRICWGRARELFA